jgi:carboxyl-terminal processing protease
MLGFFQAVREISARAVRPASVEDIARSALNAYLRDTDPYARYLCPAEYALVRDAAQASYGGVGMEIAQDVDGTIRCLPYPDGPAEQSGIMEGDTLIAVDGQPVLASDPLLLIGSRVRGPVGSEVRLGLRRRRESRVEVVVARAKVRSRSVLPAGANTLRILVFEQGTPQELREALATADAETPVVLDLRGNPGGSLSAAVECARLFLAKDKPVVEVRTRATAIRHAGREGAPFLETPGVVIWQDRHTASAAEVFTAALTCNQRARSVGQTSFGKGVTQRTTELVNGAALILTDGWLVPPDGKEYHGVGLPPDVAVEGTATVAYRRATGRLVAEAVARESQPLPKKAP